MSIIIQLRFVNGVPRRKGRGNAGTGETGKGRFCGQVHSKTEFWNEMETSPSVMIFEFPDSSKKVIKAAGEG